jgi:hypothetical protein
MEDFHCEFLEFEIRVSAEQFDKEAFLEDVKVVFDERKVTHMWGFGSLEKADKQHAHILADFRHEKRVKFIVTYHSVGLKDEDVRPPYMEDCVQWLGKFFKEEIVSANLTASFRFDKRYAPIIALPFPLLAANKELSGSVITGVSIRLPRILKIRRAILQRIKDEDTGVQIDANLNIKLKEFELKAQLEKLSVPVMMLVNPVGESK